MFKNITIKTRLVFVLAFLGMQLVIGAVIGLVSLGNANTAMQSVYEDRLVPLAQLDTIIRLLERNQLNIAAALTAEPQEAARLLAEVDNNVAEVTRNWEAYMATRLTDEEKVLAAKFVAARQASLAGGLGAAMAALRAGDRDSARTLLHGPVKQLFAPVREGVNQLIELQRAVAEQEYKGARDTYALVRTLFIVGVTLGLMLAAVIGTLLVRAIVRPLDRAVRFAEAVSAGDLSQRIEAGSRDEMGRLMNALQGMNDGLVRIVGQVRSGAESIASASGQIAAGNLDLSSRTEEQASSLEETASSMEELTSTVKQNADNAREANGLAQSASEVALKGGAVVADVVTTMESINESARKIVDIIAVIDGIAFQTNILALNAAVEAARAGEQGRGFAVVAAEVRNLAQRSASAAREVKDLIGDSVNKVEAGSRLVDDAGATMTEIVERVRRVTDIMGEITTASHEQTLGIEQINAAIAQMEDVTQQNASLVEEAAAASQALGEQTGHLAQLVSVFKLDGQEQARPVAISAPAPRMPRAVVVAAARKQLAGA